MFRNYTTYNLRLPGIFGAYLMKQEIPVRITIVHPVPGVTMQIQRGKDELVPPSAVSDDAISFDIDVTVNLSLPAPNFLGKFAQGPKDARFIYVNSGTYAGQEATCWSRRAKVSLMSITARQIEEVISSPDARLEASIFGRSGDGGPVCASVKGVEWKIVKK